MNTYSDELIDYYLREVRNLREKGSEFSHMFPKVASQIDFSGNISSDPQCERIIESFAFLSARLKKMLDDQALSVPYFLLSHLNLYLLLPAPSMTLAAMDLSPLDVQNGVVKFIKKSTVFSLEDKRLGMVKFSSVFDTVLYPFECLSESFPLADVLPNYPAQTEGKIAVSIQISATSEQVMDDLFFESLRFHIDADYTVASSIYDGISINLEDILLTDENFKNATSVSKSALRLCGFSKEEASIPIHNNGLEHFRLMQEYFAFPAKFMFFDIQKLSKRPHGKSFRIILILNEKRIKSIKISDRVFSLSTVPLVNLFYQQAQPINISSRQTNYSIISNHIQDQHSEFYMVDLVQLVDYQNAKTHKAVSYSSMSSSDKVGQLYWSVKPESGLSRDKNNWLINLIDNIGNIYSMDNSCLTIRLLCSNGDRVNSLRSGSAFSGSGDLSNLNIRLLIKPTKNYYFQSNDLLWSLLSHYRFSFLNFKDKHHVLSILKATLIFMSPERKKEDLFQIDGILDIEVKDSFRPNKKDPWKSFSKHLEIHLYLDENSFVGASVFLFSKMLFTLLQSRRSLNQTLGVYAHYANHLIIHE